jgi:hypothetical protein
MVALFPRRTEYKVMGSNEKRSKLVTYSEKEAGRRKAAEKAMASLAVLR